MRHLAFSKTTLTTKLYNIFYRTKKLETTSFPQTISLRLNRNIYDNPSKKENFRKKCSRNFPITLRLQNNYKFNTETSYTIAYVNNFQLLLRFIISLEKLSTIKLWRNKWKMCYNSFIFPVFFWLDKPDQVPPRIMSTCLLDKVFECKTSMTCVRIFLRKHKSKPKNLKPRNENQVKIRFFFQKNRYFW